MDYDEAANRRKSNEKNGGKKMAKDRFVVAYSQGLVNVETVLVDTETGVNYLLAASSLGAGLTVLVDQDGKPIVTPVK